MRKSVTIVFSLLFLATIVTRAQKEGNIWYFGSHAGLDFNNGAPVALQNSALWDNDNSSTVSDANGQLLFYTNSDTVWNRLHQIMPGGTGLYGSTSSGQCAVIVPQPGTSKYFIFTNAQFLSPHGLSYSVVDMAASGGYGDVVLKNIQLFPNTTEKLDAIYNPSDNSYWIITHPFESGYFHVYKLTSAGLSNSPVISDPCALYAGGDPNGYNAIGQMTVSPDGNTIASGVLSSGFIELCDFNRATGRISNSRIIPDFPNAWGIAFSPDSKKLYATRWWSDSVFQYNLKDPSLSSIIASKMLIGHATASNFYGYQAGYMQLGPDNRIYITRYQTHYLAVITSPNLDGPACGFVNDGVFLGAKTSTAGLSRTPAKPDAVAADFSVPDTICTGTPVNITNLSSPGSTCYWSFCSGNTLANPVGENIGNPGNLLNVPGYITLVKDGGTCYSFITNYAIKSLIRYSHGTSFSNNPVSMTNLGSFGLFSDTIMGIRICKDNGQWIGFVNNNNRIVRLNFGTSLANTPTATQLGPWPMLYVAHCLDILNENGTWVGYLTCSTGNKLVRLNFGNSLMNTPVLTNLGTPGQLNLPGSFRIVSENGAWYGLVVNMGNGTMTRLDFGNSLMNNPTGTNLGNVCPSISPGGIALIHDCESITGFQLNYSSSSPDLIWRLNFPSGITGPVTGTSLGNIGSMSRPAHFSELFREGDTLFLYNTNRDNSTLTRLRFLPCPDASVPSSTLFNPPPFSYNKPGTYNIRLIVNEGLPNEATVCKTIVAVPCAVTAAFTVPDTICTGTPVNITNQSTQGQDYYWNFCSANALSNPTGVNIGNPGGLINVTGYMTLVKDGNTCYSFVTSALNHSLVRYNHGSSFSNNPVSWTDLGGFGMMGDTLLGVKVRNDNGTWVGFVLSNNRIVRVNFGSSLANSPTAALLGPYSMLYTAHGLEIVKEGSTWLGFITCSWGNKLVRLNFGNSLLNIPVLTDLGTPGGLNMPMTFNIVNENGGIYMLVANYSDGTYSRLDFGSSLLNTPTGVNLGVACPGTVNGGMVLIRDCENTVGFQLNYSASSQQLLWRLNFPSGITGPVTGTSLGGTGDLRWPARFSELFRVGDTLFLYILNRGDNTLSRLRFMPCSNASVPSSTRYNPPSYTYNTPGTYNISLTVNEGMPDQANICKKIVVLDRTAQKTIDTTLCYGIPWHAGGAWQTQAGTYYDTIPVAGSCDSIIKTTLSYKPEIPVSLGPDTVICDATPIVLRTGVPGAAYHWQDGSADSTYTAVIAGTYWVTVLKDGCSETDSVLIRECTSPLWFPNVFTPNGDLLNDTFHPVGLGVVQFNIQVYNRWGRLVYESNETEPGWDGRHAGAVCSDGVYMYIATYRLDESSGETYHAKGSVTLLR